MYGLRLQTCRILAQRNTAILQADPYFEPRPEFRHYKSPAYIPEGVVGQCGRTLAQDLLLGRSYSCYHIPVGGGLVFEIVDREGDSLGLPWLQDDRQAGIVYEI